jgi:hypothetical protein
MSHFGRRQPESWGGSVVSKIGGHKALTPVVGITLVTQVIPVILLQKSFDCAPFKH